MHTGAGQDDLADLVALAGQIRSERRGDDAVAPPAPRRPAQRRAAAAALQPVREPEQAKESAEDAETEYEYHDEGILDAGAKEELQAIRRTEAAPEADLVSDGLAASSTDPAAQELLPPPALPATTSSSSSSTSSAVGPTGEFDWTSLLRRGVAGKKWTQVLPPGESDPDKAIGELQAVGQLCYQLSARCFNANHAK